MEIKTKANQIELSFTFLTELFEIYVGQDREYKF